MKRSSIPSDIGDFFHYDRETGVFTNLRQGIPGAPVGAVSGTIGAEGYRVLRFRQLAYMAHRVAWFLVTGEQPDVDIDHINMVRSDNRFINLRVATRAQNMWNTRAKTPHGKGVYYKPSRGKYVAQIRIGGKQTHLGVFATSEEAQHAYTAAAVKYHGEFARTE